MKKLVIFCDGTWNSLGAGERTNVALLAACVEPLAKDRHTPQIVHYDEGVGVGFKVTPMIDELTKFFGGALGKGLDGKLESAYRFLISNYATGDELYIFGFSRGAFTARSLIGLVRKCGILTRRNLDKIPEAVRLYRDTNIHPKSPTMQDFRKAFAHDVAMGPEDYERIETHLKSSPELVSQMTDSKNHLFQYRPYFSCQLMYMGLWDTVGSLGLPDIFGPLSHLINAQYRFHDLKASSLISSLRHAVAIDEDRRVFASIGFENIDELNIEWLNGSHASYNLSNSTAPDYLPYFCRPYQQKWFPGDHGAVGGGNPEPGLSSYALRWIAEGADHAGLNLDLTLTSPLIQAKNLRNPFANWHIDKLGKPRPTGETDLLGRIGGLETRKATNNLEAYSTSAYYRYLNDPQYRPKGASALRGILQFRSPPKPPSWPFNPLP